MKAQILRCPKCGKLYNAEEGDCPGCYQPAAVQNKVRGMLPEEKRVLRIFGAIIILPALASLSTAYFVIGWPTMVENLAIFPWLLILAVWIAGMVFVGMIVSQKRKSALWVWLALLIPISPLVTIPFLLAQKPRDLDWGYEALLALAVSAAFVSLFSSVIVWIR